jgi:hypothetical protein
MPRPKKQHHIEITVTEKHINKVVYKRKLTIPCDGDAAERMRAICLYLESKPEVTSDEPQTNE